MGLDQHGSSYNALGGHEPSPVQSDEPDAVAAAIVAPPVIHEEKTKVELRQSPRANPRHAAETADADDSVVVELTKSTSEG